MPFYDDGKPVGGYGVRSSSDYTIEDIVSDLGGGGSGGVGGKLVKVTISVDDKTHLIADKTNKEIYDLYSEGALIYFDIIGYNESTGKTMHTIATSYDVAMASEDNYNINVYYLFGEDKGMGEWKLQAGKLMSHIYYGSNKQFDPFKLSLS